MFQTATTNARAAGFRYFQANVAIWVQLAIFLFHFLVGLALLYRV
jgi:hypothetical protein